MAWLHKLHGVLDNWSLVTRCKHWLLGPWHWVHPAVGGNSANGPHGRVSRIHGHDSRTEKSVGLYPGDCLQTLSSLPADRFIIAAIAD